MAQYIKLKDPVGLAVLDTTDYYNEGLIITRINVPQAHRGKHIASKLLQQECDNADLNNITLWLEIQSSDGLTHNELEAWYKRYGFKGVSIYKRNPKGK
jgi:predicted GNAT family N-acyltransferase